MRTGAPANILENVVCGHPVEASEKVPHMNGEKRELASVRRVQGLHMPFKLNMEKAIASKIRRLPGLPSSNLAMRTLMGAEGLGPEDIFNDISDK
jgi:proteasome maturation protein